MLKMASKNCYKKLRSEKSYSLHDILVGLFTISVVLMVICEILLSRLRLTNENNDKCRHECGHSLKLDEAPPKPSLDEKFKNTRLNPSDRILDVSRNYANTKNDLKTKKREYNDPSSVECSISWSMLAGYFIMVMILGLSICSAFLLVAIIYQECKKKESSDYECIDEIRGKMQINVTFNRKGLQNKYEEV